MKPLPVATSKGLVILFIEDFAKGGNNQTRGDSPSLSGPLLNTRWAFRNSGEKLRLFQEWLAETLGETLLDAASEEAYWEAFVADGYAKGAGRSFEQVMAKKPRFGPGEGQFFQGAKAQFLAESFTAPIAVERVKLIAGRVFTDLKDITDTMSTQMSRVLADGLAQGMSPREVARKMNTQVDLGRARSLRVARSETVRAHAEGQLDSLERLGVESVGVAVEWSTSKMGFTRLGNPSPCPLCAPLQGVVMKLKEARGLLPRHPNSLVGESVVKASGVVALVEATYTGNLVTITTSSGKTVTTTENHIHLTQFGFLQAKFLQQGMNLLDASKGYSMGSLVDHNDTGVTSIANVFKTLSPFASIEVREPRAMDFHGDGKSMHKEVRIIKTDGILWDQLQTKLGSVSVEEMFPLIDFVKDYRTLATESPSTTFLKGIASTFDSSMGLCRDSLSLLLGCLTQPETSGLGLSTGVDSVSFKSPSDDTTTTTKMLRDCLNAHPFLKQFNDLVDWDNCLVPLRSIPRDTQNVQTPFDGVTFDPESFGQGLPSLPSLIALDQIVNVRIEHVDSLPVYDMQTQSSLIIADGVTMSQCMCSYIPANVGETRKQKKTQKSIRKAVKSSVRAEKGKGSLAKKRRQSSWQGADLKPSKVRPKPFVSNQPLTTHHADHDQSSHGRGGGGGGLSKSQSSYAKSIVDSPTEKWAVFDGDTIVSEGEGDSANATISGDAGVKGKAILHNHPGSHDIPLSAQDLSFASIRGVSSMTAVTRDSQDRIQVTTITEPDKGWGDFSERLQLSNQWFEIHRKHRSPGKDIAVSAHEAWQEFSLSSGISYSKRELK